MSEQLSLFDIARERTPTWDDCQKGTAEWARHQMYSVPCSPDCLHHGSIFELMGEASCYLFRKSIRGGMCPSTGGIEWK